MVGYDANNRNILNEQFICSKCSFILREPVQLTNCGHRICQSCLPNQTKDLTQCPQCQIQTSSNEIMIDRGFHKEMQSLSIICSYCDWNDTLKNYQTHLDECHSNPTCCYCQQRFVSVNELTEHQLSQCRNVLIDCLLKDFGCEQQILQCDTSSHYCSKQHQDSIMMVVTVMKSQLTNSQSITTSNDNDEANQLTSLSENINIIQHAIESFGSDREVLTDEMTDITKKLTDLLEHLTQVKTVSEEENAVTMAVKQNLEVLKEELIALEESINDNEYVSYDGTYIWKISNVSEKLRDAQSERQISIYSPPFYSSPTGYKMRARLYLHGDGNARRTHMSLFFVLMRGPNDAILKFPFNYKVTFCLYDQTAQKRHIIDSFRPDIRSNSFQRPRSEMNIASGIPKFFPLSMIEQPDNPYVRDDTMFIQVMVDFIGLPEHVTQYAVNLNSGLPKYIQQILIKHELENSPDNMVEYLAQIEGTNEVNPVEAADAVPRDTDFGEETNERRR